MGAMKSFFFLRAKEKRGTTLKIGEQRNATVAAAAHYAGSNVTFSRVNLVGERVIRLALRQVDSCNV